MLLDHGINEITPYVVRIVIEKNRTLANSGKWIVLEFDEINKYRDLHDNLEDQIEDYFHCVNASRNEKNPSQSDDVSSDGDVPRMRTSSSLGKQQISKAPVILCKPTSNENVSRKSPRLSSKKNTGKTDVSNSDTAHNDVRMDEPMVHKEVGSEDLNSVSNSQNEDSSSSQIHIEEEDDGVDNEEDLDPNMRIRVKNPLQGAKTQLLLKDNNYTKESLHKECVDYLSILCKQTCPYYHSNRYSKCRCLVDNLHRFSVTDDDLLKESARYDRVASIMVEWVSYNRKYQKQLMMDWRRYASLCDDTYFLPSIGSVPTTLSDIDGTEFGLLRFCLKG